MSIREAFDAEYEKLPLLEDGSKEVRISTESHRSSIMHLPNRRCRRCVGEVAQNVMRDAIHSGETVMNASRAAMVILRDLGFTQQQAIAALKNN